MRRRDVNHDDSHTGYAAGVFSLCVSMALSPVPHIELRLQREVEPLKLQLHRRRALPHFLQRLELGIHVQRRRRLDSARRRPMQSMSPKVQY
jgi:hypothetical protein